MGTAFLHGNGGVPLNYRVVGGTSAPSNPAENTIWVNTSTTITSHVFSATQPTGSAGMVWFKTGTSSNATFNALKKNAINVYPLTCEQYVSGAWVSKTAKIYIGSKWADWSYTLFDKTGGINNLGGWVEYHSDYITSPTINSGGNLQFGMSGHSYNTVANELKIDVTPYKTMKFTVVSKNISDNVYVGLSSRLSGFGSWDTTHFVAQSTNPAVGTHTIDISTVNGIKYFAVTLHAKVAAALVLSNIKFE